MVNHDRNSTLCNNFMPNLLGKVALYRFRRRNNKD